MNKILVPTDFSQEAENALAAAVDIANRSGAEILLLHVVEDPNIQLMKVIGEDKYDPMQNLFVKLLIDKTKIKLETIVNEDRFSNLNISYKMDVGNAYSSISENIASHECTLICMGTKGASGLQELLVGSVADKTVRHATCPVITINGKAKLDHVKHIVFATDLQNDQDQIVTDIKELQKFYGAFLHILKVYDSSWMKKEEVEERIQDFAKDHNIENYTTNVEKSSDQAEAILNFSRDIDADIIAMGAHDRHGLLHLIAKQVSKNVVNHAHRAVWTKAIR